MHLSLYALRKNVDSLYEYMRALATQELNPMIIPPDILKKILHKIVDDIKSNARLKLCKDPETNIWFYYGTVKLSLIVLQDYLMLILTAPLVDQSLQMNIYKVHNLPMLHPTLNVHAQYELEGTYFATLMESMFISLPTALDVKLCLVTNGHLCMFNQALLCYVRQRLRVLEIVLDFFKCLGFHMCFISLYGALSLHNCSSSGLLVFTHLGGIN